MDSGAVYTYKRDPGGQWLLVDELTPLDHAADQHFGASVATSGDDLIVGAPIDANASGSAYIFRRQGDHWSEVTKLVAGGEPVQRELGTSVDICGDLAIVGAFIDNVQGDYSGSAYIYRRDRTGQWRQDARLLAPDGRPNDVFGSAVAISGNLAFALAPNHANANQSYGAVYTYRWNGRYWVAEDQVILPRDYISSFAVLGDVLLIGAAHDDEFGYSSGAVYAFRRASNGVWNQARKFFADDAHGSLAFGSSLSLCDGKALIGAIAESYYGEASGAAYLFDLNCAPGVPQLLAEPTCPDGGPIRIEWTGATPRGTVNVLFARQDGHTMIPAGWPCSGVPLRLGVEGIRLAWRGSAGADGNRTIVGEAAGSACGGYLQLIDSGTCLTSNVVHLE